MSYSLAISLGHNSSAVLIQDGVVLGGYEEERFNGIKSSSTFPINSIMALQNRFQLPKDTNSYIGHWFTDACLPAANKYWAPQVLRDLYPNGGIDSLNIDLTHHDSHLESAIVFAGKDWSEDYTAIVADGFGSFGECISFYRCTRNGYRLLYRVRGFENSLGLLYQYATAFCGMKMHNHEYKMLAYEVHVNEVLDDVTFARVQSYALERASTYIKEMFNLKLGGSFDPVTNVAALPMVQMFINDMLARLLQIAAVENSDERTKRVVVSYFVQAVVEAVMIDLAKMYTDTDDLLVVGGLFYNVKLNHLLANQTKGKFCAMPLAGDQGAALGVYQAYRGDLVWPEHVYWGHRNLAFAERDTLPAGLHLVDTEEQAEELIRKRLASHGWVNVVRGAMEFGPRALCNTSTIALPSARIAMDVNRANDRTMEMPFAPVMTKEQADNHFEDIGKVHKSLEYMIMTRKFKKDMDDGVSGAAHYYPREDVYTGRPQITNDQLMLRLLSDHGPLINTSFNFHGVPIVNTEAQIVYTHIMQRQTAPDLDATTIIIRS